KLLEIVSEKYPGVMRIVLTAYDDSEAVIDAINKGRVHNYLLKSVDMTEVKITIKNALDTYFLREENKQLMTELTRINKALRNRTSGLEKEISKRRRVEEAMRKHHEQLEDLVKERTKELESKNEQLTREIAEHRQTEKELKQSEERYSLAERASGIGSWDRDIKTGDLKWSDTIEPLFGFKKGGFEKTHEAFLKVVHPEDRQFVIDSVNACIEEGKEYKIEHRIVCPDGSIKWVLETGDAIRDEYGNAIRTLGVVMDITTRKQAEEELKLNEERLEALLKLNLMKDVTERKLCDFALEECVRLTRSKVGYYHYVNEDQRTIRLFCWSKDVLKQCTAGKTPHYPIDEAGVWADCIRLRQPVIHNDYLNLPDKKGLPDGHFPVNRHMSVPVFEEGKIVAVVGVGNKEEHYDQSDVRQLSLFMNNMWEILKRKKVGEALVEAEEQSRLLLESAGEGIFGADLDGRITFLNPAAAKMLGYSADELIGQPVHERIHHSCSNGSPHPKEDCPMFSTFTKGSIHHVDNEVLWRKDGTNFFVDYTSTPVRKNGKLVAAVVTFMDITESKHTAKELEKAREAADAANRAKSEFLANMSHEIRTPMNAVIGYADLLTQLVSEETQRNYLDSIKTSGRSLMKLIDDILDLSKIEAGKLELQFEFVDTYSFFEEMEHIFSFQITEKGLDFIVNITSGTPRGLYIDEIRVRQILLNLLGNAIKFTEKGHIKLSVWPENPQVVEYSKNKIEEYVD
ncbi:MAG: PAS domain S-box protein, partial [Bacteroidales bacterium]|nr:PAS domain S-box protein [Bacteroidales bacterium]